MLVAMSELYVCDGNETLAVTLVNLDHVTRIETVEGEDGETWSTVHFVDGREIDVADSVLDIVHYLNGDDDEFDDEIDIDDSELEDSEE